MQTAHIEVQIRERAYALWEQEGRPEGREWDHWVRAASEVVSPASEPAMEAAEAASAKKPARKAASKPKAKKTALS
jgi:DUF2934 family protein